MSCARARQMLDALVDGELDAATEREIEAHLAGCGECAGMRAARIALRQRVRREAPYFAAPESLKSALRRAPQAARTLAQPTWTQAGWLAASAAAFSLVAGFWIGRPPADDARRDAAVASHVASLAPGRRLIDVASSDRHSVKPWFVGKLDFAPPVPDLAAEGYGLVGARIDHVGDRQAAATVYRLRNHDINLFAWRAAAEAQREPVQLSLVRGFGVATWARDGLRFAAVSDLDQRDLERFAALVAR